MEPAWACRVGQSESAQVSLAVWSWGSPQLEVVGPLASDLPGPDPRRHLDLGNGMGSPLNFSAGTQLCAQPGVIGLAHIHVWTPEATQCQKNCV